ncbi:hypothetical protein BCR37DRAFT_391996 [Protomyces lactucae-debilis]|uniref:Transmembrane protein UsgS n=1 Tax=Protomyces lactucae-debilis TaxID=2754530 RepID=A0A1Y2FLF8_PROLT|nr:uncharacterized protein BCR37DRAFT_391996 [Protomyces lactucae-debilis]ORY84417.1 hypothetical protein BCR37DRAFT_391996 [Protomyces lactucae-debilis]
MLASPAQLKALSPIHILRGAQLAWLGLLRALENKELYTSEHYKQLLLAVAIGVALRIITWLPVFLFRGSVTILSAVVDVRRAHWEQDVLAVLHFIQHWVISVPTLVVNYMRSVEPKPFDDLFMSSMSWVDSEYERRHQGEDKASLRPAYTTNLKRYKPEYRSTFVNRTLKRTGLGLIIYLLSFTPKVGSLVLPAVSFYTLHQAVGLVPAGVFFALATLILPRHYFVVLLQTYFSTRSLTRQLLQPYFARVGKGFTTYQKAKWFREREGVVFGFALPFVLALRIPYVGIMTYGLASTCAAFLVSKVTTPPPESGDLTDLQAYAASEVVWTQGRRNLVKAGLEKLDAVVADDSNAGSSSHVSIGQQDISAKRKTAASSRQSSRGGSDDEWVKLATPNSS